ncbi:hypothetical protein [Pseudomonas knackmussii]|uniref:hypothetical protein n=1 Tax=Pseudomonas knackmussii TaxID=65741 RepID=UPI003F4A3E48
MTLFRGLFLLCAGVGCCVPSVRADDGGWQVDASTYLWFPKTESRVETPFGMASSTLSARDALDALDAGVMAGISARRGPWSLVGDLFYLDLSFHERTPVGHVFSSIDTRTTLASLAGYGLYSLYEDDRFAIDAGAGLRMMSSDIDITLQGLARPDQETSVSDTWVDPLLAIRTSAKLGERWRAVLWADGGGFDIDDASDRTWQLSALLVYRISETWSASGGYRDLYVERENQSVPYSLELSGPLLGVSYRF